MSTHLCVLQNPHRALATLAGEKKTKERQCKSAQYNLVQAKGDAEAVAVAAVVGLVPDRLAAGPHRCLLCQSSLWRRRHRPQPHGSQQIGQQAPCDDRRPRHPFGSDGHSGQRQRGHAGLPRVDEHAGRRRQAGPEAAEAPALARGSGLRLRAGAAFIALAGDHTDLGCSQS